MISRWLSHLRASESACVCVHVHVCTVITYSYVGMLLHKYIHHVVPSYLFIVSKSPLLL